MLGRSYDIQKPDKASQDLGAELLEHIVNSGVTYKQALNALEVTLKFLEEQTIPVRRPSAPGDGSESMP